VLLGSARRLGQERCAFAEIGGDVRAGFTLGLGPDANLELLLVVVGRGAGGVLLAEVSWLARLARCFVTFNFDFVGFTDRRRRNWIGAWPGCRVVFNFESC